MMRTINKKIFVMIMMVICFCLTPFRGNGAESGGTNNSIKVMNDKGFSLLRQVSRSAPGKNILLSPYNIQQTFAMLAAGAEGATANEIAKTFGFSPETAAWFNQSAKSMAASDTAKVLTFNTILLGAGEKILPGYASVLEQYYSSKLYRINLARPESVAAKINAMVARQTEGMISRIVDPGMISPQMSMFLLSALYFRADWALPFDPQNTDQREFRGANGRTTLIPMMEMTERVDYFHITADGIHGMILPYRDQRFQFIAIKPKSDKITLADVIAHLEKGKLDSWLARASSRNETKIRLPKINLESTLSLDSILRQAGVKLSFSGKADFSKINGKRNLFLSRVIHVTKLELDEKQTRAAAVTLLMPATCAPEEQAPSYNTFYADSPFLVIIRDSKTEAVLFTGVIHDLQ